jgi:hypothetical protein
MEPGGGEPRGVADVVQDGRGTEQVRITRHDLGDLRGPAGNAL